MLLSVFLKKALRLIKLFEEVCIYKSNYPVYHSSKYILNISGSDVYAREVDTNI